MKENFKTNLIIFLKGAITSISISLFAILIFAFVIRLTNIPDGVIMPVNQVIKIISILFGIIIGLKGHKSSGLLRGVAIGVLYTVFAYLTFSILSGKFVFNISNLYDVVFGAIAGAICGIFVVNFSKN